MLGKSRKTSLSGIAVLVGAALLLFAKIFGGESGIESTQLLEILGIAGIGGGGLFSGVFARDEGQ